MSGVRYNPDDHLKDCLTTWKDAGWLEKGQEDLAAEFFASGSSLVALQDGRAAALAVSGHGSIRHTHHSEDLPFCSIDAVTVAFHGRKKGYAAALTAELLAEAALKGEACAGLGMFEQGFYDRLGFSNMPYWKSVYLRPSEILIEGELTSSPVRLSGEHWQEIHESRISRERCHGSLNLAPMSTKAALQFSRNSFVLGFNDQSGKLTHHICFESVKGENGPAFAGWLVYRNSYQFRDLMLLLKSLGDQIDLVRISEPSGIQMQSIMKRPVASRRKSLTSTGQRVEVRTISWTQCRILSLAKCINDLHSPGRSCSFNLRLEDPVGKSLDSSISWRGCSGEYTVHLSENSETRRGFSPGLPLLECSVNTFTKLWNGTVRPTLLPYTDSLKAPEGLLKAVEEAIPMPEPFYDWDL